jgi:hypothetical protein
LNKLVYDDIPPLPKRGGKKPAQPHPYKARAPHEYWFIDGRQLDFALDGVKWWSLIILEGYSRTILAGAMARTEATWAALMVLYTACLRYGAPPSLVSDSGGAYTSNEFEAVCTRLQIQHETIVSTQGESYLKGMGIKPHPPPCQTCQARLSALKDDLDVVIGRVQLCHRPRTHRTVGSDAPRD